MRTFALLASITGAVILVLFLVAVCVDVISSILYHGGIAR